MTRCSRRLRPPRTRCVRHIFNQCASVMSVQKLTLHEECARRPLILRERGSGKLAKLGMTETDHAAVAQAAELARDAAKDAATKARPLHARPVMQRWRTCTGCAACVFACAEAHAARRPLSTCDCWWYLVVVGNPACCVLSCANLFGYHAVHSMCPSQLLGGAAEAKQSLVKPHAGPATAILGGCTGMCAELHSKSICSLGVFSVQRYAALQRRSRAWTTRTPRPLCINTRHLHKKFARIPTANPLLITLC